MFCKTCLNTKITWLSFKILRKYRLEYYTKIHVTLLIKRQSSSLNCQPAEHLLLQVLIYILFILQISLNAVDMYRLFNDDLIIFTNIFKELSL